MQNQFLETLVQPISDDAPCGPDLDAEGDGDFTNFLATVDGKLPGSFFVPDPVTGLEKPRERGNPNFEAEAATAKTMLRRTRDIRVLVAMAKFAALDRNLPEFVDVVEAIAGLLDARWAEVNPRDQGDDFALRLAAVQALDEVKHTVLPLQFTILIRHPRIGPITFRQKMLADGAPAREGEEFPDAATISRAFAEIPIEELVAARDLVRRLHAANDLIDQTTQRQVCARQAVCLAQLDGLAKQMLDFLDDAVRARDPTAALGAQGRSETGGEPLADATAPSASGGLTDFRQVAAVLAGVVAYFDRHEPSNPALLLLKQAQTLVGRNFVEIMRLIAPNLFDQAVFGIGRDHKLVLPMQILSENFSGTNYGDSADDAEVSPIADKNAAIAALQMVEAFYARSEPSSPVPYLCAQARKFASADFLSILREILPEGSLKTHE